MPANLERRLRQEAKRKRIKNKDAYVYGTMRKIGWKPEREQALKRRLRK